MVVSIAGPQVAYALLDVSHFRGRQGLWRSDDGGAVWNRRRERPVGLLAVGPGNPDVVYAGVSGSAPLNRSDDGGATFVPLPATFAPDLAEEARVVDLELSVDGVSGWLLTTEGAIYTSSDGLLTWRLLSDQGPPGKVRDLALAHSDERLLYAINDAGEVWLHVNDGAAR
jgi:photosystem II stability/assembly factor-like uncharacterized protein